MGVKREITTQRRGSWSPRLFVSNWAQNLTQHRAVREELPKQRKASLFFLVFLSQICGYGWKVWISPGNENLSIHPSICLQYRLLLFYGATTESFFFWGFNSQLSLFVFGTIYFEKTNVTFISIIGSLHEGSLTQRLTLDRIFSIFISLPPLLFQSPFFTRNPTSKI